MPRDTMNIQRIFHDQVFNPFLLLAGNLDSIRVHDLEAVVLGWIVACSNDKPGSSTTLCEKLQPRGGYDATVFHPISLREYPRNRPLREHLAGSSSISTHEYF